MGVDLPVRVLPPAAICDGLRGQVVTRNDSYGESAPKVGRKMICKPHDYRSVPLRCDHHVANLKHYPQLLWGWSHGPEWRAVMTIQASAQRAFSPRPAPPRRPSSATPATPSSTLRASRPGSVTAWPRAAPRLWVPSTSSTRSPAGATRRWSTLPASGLRGRAQSGRRRGSARVRRGPVDLPAADRAVTGRGVGEAVGAS